jgi:hypothetical protein
VCKPIKIKVHWKIASAVVGYGVSKIWSFIVKMKG